MGYVQAVIAAGALAYSIIQGERGARAQRQAQRRQDEAQAEAQNLAAAEQRTAEAGLRKQNAKKPNIAALLEQSRQGAAGGAQSTFLSRPGTTPLGG